MMKWYRTIPYRWSTKRWSTVAGCGHPSKGRCCFPEGYVWSQIGAFQMFSKKVFSQPVWEISLDSPAAPLNVTTANKNTTEIMVTNALFMMPFLVCLQRLTQLNLIFKTNRNILLGGLSVFHWVLKQKQIQYSTFYSFLTGAVLVWVKHLIITNSQW